MKLNKEKPTDHAGIDVGGRYVADALILSPPLDSPPIINLRTAQ